MKTSSACTLVLTLALASASSSFAAQIVFSNLTQPGNQYGPDGVGIGAIPVPGLFIQVATKFTPSVTTKLLDFELPIGLSSGPNQVAVSLLADAGGSPGAVIEMYQLISLPSAVGGLTPLTTVASATNPLLTAGQQYWIEATGGTSTTFAQWTLTLFAGDPAAGGATKLIQNGVDTGWRVGPGTRTGALVVDGVAAVTNVPEPRSLSQMLIGLAAIVLTVLRSNRPSPAT